MQVTVISNLNPDDIESMSILKGALLLHCTVRRAAHGGVILITTKKG